MMPQRGPEQNIYQSQNIKTLLLRQAVYIYTAPIKYLFYRFGDYLVLNGGVKIIPTKEFTPYYLYCTCICPSCGLRFRFANPPWYCSVCGVFVAKPLVIYYIAVLSGGNRHMQKVPKDKMNVLHRNGVAHFYVFELGDMIECARII